MAKVILLTLFALSTLKLSSGLTAVQLRFKISKLQCEPLNGGVPQPCYDFSKKKIVPLEDCNKKQNSHCCEYNCTCVIKGAGHKRGKIPAEHVMPETQLPAKKRAIAARLSRGCPILPTTTVITRSAPTTPKRRTRRPRTKRPPTKKPTRRPGLTAIQLRAKISKLQCEPLNGAKPQPCYDFSKKGIVPFEDCNNKRNSHCCEYNCACIVKGAGHTRGIIPKKYALTKIQLLAEKRANVARLSGGCPRLPTTTERTTRVKPTTPKRMTRKPRTTRKPITKRPPTKKPTRKPRTKKPSTTRPTRKTTRKTPTTDPTKKPCPTTTTKKPSFSFGFFNRFSNVLSRFGIETDVVAKNEDC